MLDEGHAVAITILGAISMLTCEAHAVAIVRVFLPIANELVYQTHHFTN